MDMGDDVADAKRETGLQIDPDNILSDFLFAKFFRDHDPPIAIRHLLTGSVPGVGGTGMVSTATIPCVGVKPSGVTTDNSVPRLKSLFSADSTSGGVPPMSISRSAGSCT